MRELEAEVLRVKRLEGGILGFEVSLPNSPPLIVVLGRRAFVACGLLNIEVAERLNVPCARVVGVRSVEDVLEKEIAEATTRARELGILPGLRVKDVLDKL